MSSKTTRSKPVWSLFKAQSRLPTMGLALFDSNTLRVCEQGLERQPTPIQQTVDPKLIRMAIQTRPPVITPSNREGEYDVLVNATTVLWHRMLPAGARASVPRIACFLVEASESDRAQWRTIDQWAADQLCGWLTARRSAEMRRGMRGTRLAGSARRESLRRELAQLLEKNK